MSRALDIILVKNRDIYTVYLPWQLKKADDGKTVVLPALQKDVGWQLNLLCLSQVYHHQSSTLQLPAPG